MNGWSAAALLTAAIFYLSPASVTLAQSAPTSGQNAPASDSSASKDSASPQAPQEPRKVWTNDDLAGAPDKSASSSAGNSKTSSRRASAGRDSSEYLVRSYRAQIDQLQKKMADIDKQIADLQAALSGKTVDEPRKYNAWGGRIGDWNAQLEQVQKNRQNLQD